MKTLDIFPPGSIIYVSVTKTMITFLNTFNLYFTDRNIQSSRLGGGAFSPTIPYNALSLIFFKALLEAAFRAI